MTPNRYAELEGLGLRSLGELAQLPGGAVAERLGVEGRNAWRLARGGRKARVRGPQARLGARRGTHLSRSDCERAHAATGARLPPRAPARASRTGRAAVSKTRAGRPARRRRLVAAGDDAARRDGRGRLGCERRSGRSCRSSPRRSSSSASRRSSSRSTRASSSRSSSRRGRRHVVRLREGLRQVRASTGSGSVCSVVEVAPWSRIPEARALVVPKDI